MVFSSRQSVLPGLGGSSIIRRAYVKERKESECREERQGGLRDGEHPLQLVFCLPLFLPSSPSGTPSQCMGPFMGNDRIQPATRGENGGGG